MSNMWLGLGHRLPNKALFLLAHFLRHAAPCSASLVLRFLSSFSCGLSVIGYFKLFSSPLFAERPFTVRRIEARTFIWARSFFYSTDRSDSKTSS